MLSQSVIVTLTFLISSSLLVTSTEMTNEEIVLFQRRQIKNRLKILSESGINARTESSKQVDIGASKSHKKIDDFLRMNSTETFKGTKLLISHDEIHELHSNSEQNQIYRAEQQIMNMPTTERKVEKKKCKSKTNADEKKQKIERERRTTYNIKEEYQKEANQFYNTTFKGVSFESLNNLVDPFKMKQQWEIEKEEYDSNTLDKHQKHLVYMNKDKYNKEAEQRSAFLRKNYEGLKKLTKTSNLIQY